MTTATARTVTTRIRPTRGTRHVAPAPGLRPATLPIVTVCRDADGRLFHTWCDRPLDFQGRRAGLELDFYCSHCVEHVTVPECVLLRVPPRGAVNPDRRRPSGGAGSPS